MIPNNPIVNLIEIQLVLYCIFTIITLFHKRTNIYTMFSSLSFFIIINTTTNYFYLSSQLEKIVGLIMVLIDEILFGLSFTMSVIYNDKFREWYFKMFDSLTGAKNDKNN